MLRAEQQVADCLNDLTTNGTATNGHNDASDWAGLSSQASRNPTLEHHPELYDGGVDWVGTLFTPDGPNLFTYLPVALRNYPAFKRGDEAAHRAFFGAGFAPGSEQQWDDHYAEYWDLTQRTYREEFDPGYDGPLQAGTPFCQPGTPFCDADYDYASRPQAVRRIRPPRAPRAATWGTSAR